MSFILCTLRARRRRIFYTCSLCNFVIKTFYFLNTALVLFNIPNGAHVYLMLPRRILSQYLIYNFKFQYC